MSGKRKKIKPKVSSQSCMHMFQFWQISAKTFFKLLLSFSFRLWWTGKTISWCVFKREKRTTEAGLTGLRGMSFIWYEDHFVFHDYLVKYIYIFVYLFIFNPCMMEHLPKLFSPGTYLWGWSLQANLQKRQAIVIFQEMFYNKLTVYLA